MGVCLRLYCEPVSSAPIQLLVQRDKHKLGVVFCAAATRICLQHLHVQAPPAVSSLKAL